MKLMKQLLALILLFFLIAIYLRCSYELAVSDVTGSYCRDIPDGTSILWLEKDSTYRKI